MKKLHSAEIWKHYEFNHKILVNYAVMPFVYELKAHDSITLDMCPTFGAAAKSFKEIRAKGHPYESLAVWKINTSTGRRTRVAMNPLYI